MNWTTYGIPLLQGAWVTIQLTFYSTVLGGIFSFAFGIGKLSRNRAIKGASIAVIELFRGTSLLVQLFWLYLNIETLKKQRHTQKNNKTNKLTNTENPKKAKNQED